MQFPRGLLLLIISVIAFPCLSQITLRGKVVSNKNNEPLPFVNIVITGANDGTVTDIDGRFKIVLSPNQSLEFRYVGFESQVITPSITSDKIIIRLKEKAIELNEVAIQPEDNPALKIIQKVIDNRSVHDPENLPSFTYNSYNKFSCELKVVGKYKSVGKDSAQLKKIIDNNQAFVSESYTEKKYVKPNQHKEVVLGNRMSGVKDPFFTFLATDFQPFGFHKEFIPLLGMNYLNPIGEGSLQRYDYTLMDTVYHEQDSIYIISFEPLPGKKFDGLKGQLYISTDGYAIEHVIAGAADEHALIEIHIQQKYEKKGGYWFPIVLNSEMIFKEYKIRILRPYYSSRSQLSNIRIGEKINKNEFDLLNVSFSPDANRQSEAFWDAHRADSLSRKEKNTYKLYDSLKHKLRAFNGMFKTFEALLVGKFKAGPFYLPTENFLRFNKYEGTRLGLGIQTGEQISKWISLEAYAGYGIKDKAWKYGGGVQLNILPRKDAFLKITYKQDLTEPGSTNFIKGAGFNGNEALRNWITSRMDSIQQMKAEFSIRPLPYSQFNVFLSQQKRNPTYSYQYQTESDPAPTSKQFVSTDIGLQWRFAFRESFTQIGNHKIVTNVAYPQFHISVSKSLLNVFDGQYDFTKAEIKIDQQWKFRVIGKSTIEFASGYSWGQIPYPFLFNGKGTKFSNSPRQGFIIPNYFQTMGLYEFVSDRYAYLFFQHNFGRIISTRSQYFRPELSLTQNAGIGKLSHPEYHKGIDFKTMEKGYLESGMLISNLLRFKYYKLIYYGIGGGVFYRYGPYQLPDQKDNISFKLIISASF